MKRALFLPCLGVVSLLVGLGVRTPAAVPVAAAAAAPLSGNPYCGLAPPSPGIPGCDDLDFDCWNAAYNAYVLAYEMASQDACDAYANAVATHSAAAATINIALQDCNAAAAKQGIDNQHCLDAANAAYQAIDQALANQKTRIANAWTRRTSAALSTYQAAAAGCCPPEEELPQE